MRFTASEWARIEHELTRERGLWGPDEPSHLDKWMLDFVEGLFVCLQVDHFKYFVFYFPLGPNRMRKRICRNYLFYDHYKNIPNSSSLKVYNCTINPLSTCTCTCMYINPIVKPLY